MATFQKITCFDDYCMPSLIIFAQIDPRSDSTWVNLANPIETDGVHAQDRVGPGQNNKGELSRLGCLCNNDVLCLFFERNCMVLKL